MTLLSVVRDVCAVVGVQLPTSVTSGINANRTMQEMFSVANEMVQRIAFDTRDWVALRNSMTFAGDGTKPTYTLPANYKRLLLTSNVYRSSNPLQPMRFVPDSDEWLRRRLSNWTEPNGEWILGADGSGGIGMTIYPTLPLGTTVVFNYLAKGCVKLASGGYNDAFLADNDSFILDERLLKLGMIWQWKQNKGTSYAEDMGTYETALSVAAGHDRPAPIIVGRRPISANARTAYPWPVPT